MAGTTIVSNLTQFKQKTNQLGINTSSLRVYSGLVLIKNGTRQTYFREKKVATSHIYKEQQKAQQSLLISRDSG